MNSGSFERHTGFTLVEMVVVLVIASFVLGMSAIALREYGARTSARRAADMFARDLVIARTTALRERAVVSIVFDEFGLAYKIHSSAGRVVATRGFGPGTEVPLGTIDLELTEDSVPFNARGISTLAGAAGSLGTAQFGAGSVTYSVSFSGLGAAEVSLVP